MGGYCIYEKIKCKRLHIVVYYTMLENKVKTVKDKFKTLDPKKGRYLK